MKPLLAHESTPFERALMLMHPIWARFARWKPNAFAAPSGYLPHPSAMLREPNRLWRLIFPRFFKRISVDDAEIERLKAAAQDSIIVYVTKITGQLEYSYFNHLFVEKGLPLSTYTNALTLRRWMKPKAFWRSIAAQEQEITANKRPYEPLADGFLPKMVARGECVLIRIPQSDLQDEAIVLTGPLRAIVALIEAQRSSERPITIVPLDFLWSRRPAGTRKSLIDILFGEKESPGSIRKCVLFWRNYKRRAQASIGTPLNLKNFLEENAGKSDEQISYRLRTMLLSALRAQRRTITGPPIRPRSWFIQEVISDEGLDQTVCKLAEDRGEKTDDVRELALRYIKEIASDLDYTYAELLERVLGMSLIRLFDSFDIEPEGLAAAKALFEKGPIVFVPNHRSHVDYLILSYVLYHHGMTIPHIAAGANLSFWPLGHIFRRCGAFFIRRSFRDNPLYRDVLTTYIKVLLKEGLCQEFFIEGGRSRTGKLKYPKMGMLQMLLRAAQDAKIENLSFVPVSITYDQVIEHRSYVRELDGEKKENEKPSHLLELTKYMRRPKHRFGSIYIRFGEPLPARGNALDQADVRSLAFDICHEINRRTVATPAAVAAASLLCVARTGVTEAEFERNAGALLACLHSKGVEIPAKLAADPKIVLREAVQKLAAQKLVTMRSDALEPFIAVEESRRVPLSYFRNVIVHYLVTGGIVSRLLLWYARQGRNPTIDELASEIRIYQHLLHYEFSFATRLSVEEHVTRAVDFLASQGAVSRSEGGRVAIIPEGLWVLDVFSAQVRPFIETMWIAARYASEKVTSAKESRVLIQEMMRAGLDLFMLGRVRFRESVTKEGFENALRALVEYGVLLTEPQEPGKKRRNAYLPAIDPGKIQNLKVELEKLL